MLWNVSLNSNGHQFHQYQQHEQPPPILTHSTQTTTTTYDVGNPSPGWRQTQQCVVFVYLFLLCFVWRPDELFIVYM